jgi:uncharacterized protein (TIGR02569 family)
MEPVPAEVLAAFGAGAPTTRLDGGLGPAYRSGSVVLKHVDDEKEAALVAEVMAQVDVDADRVRLARPIVGPSGRWVVRGWTAWTLVEGRHLDGAQPWEDVLGAIEALDDGLAAVSLDADQLAARTHRWAVADRVAWDEETVDLHPRLAELFHELREMTAPVRQSSQLVHGDVCSNLLFDAGLPPAIIDFSPYVRPRALATAVYAFDAVGWHRAPDDLFERVAEDPAVLACLPRAAIFRLVALDGQRRELHADIEPHLPPYERTIAALRPLLERAR